MQFSIECKRMMASVAVALTLAGSQAWAQGEILGTAQQFAVLGGSTVTNTGPTVVTGDLGVWPGNAVTGFPPGIVNGTIHAGDAVAQQAQSDVTTAYNALAGMAMTQDLTGMDLGGMTLLPGVYVFSSSAGLTGTLTLDAEGDPEALFVFQIGSTLTTASNSSVVVINNANMCNVYWQIGSSATLGTGTEFVGNILALASITLTTGATILDGRALARNGAVTLDSNTITAGCMDSGSTFRIDGDCPGAVVVSWSGFAPNQPMVILFAYRTGSFVLPDGVCAGTQLGLGRAGLQIVYTGNTGPDGSGEVRGTTPACACNGYLQMLIDDGIPCTTSEVIAIN